jgi:drug/metabolite transporter (DMT)-like permease
MGEINVRDKASIAQIVVSSIAFGSAGIFTKLLSGLSSWTVVTYRILFSAFFLALVLIIRREWDTTWLHSRKLFSLVILSSIFQVYLSILFFTMAVFYTTAITATIIFFTFPIFTIFISKILLRENISMKKIIGLFIGVSGLLFIFWNDSLYNNFFVSWKGCLFALIGAVCWALGSTLNKMVKSSIKPLTQTFIGFFISSFLALILGSIILKSYPAIQPVTQIDWMLFGLFGFVTGCIAHLLFNSALSKLSISLANSLMLFEPIAAVILAWIILGEKVNEFFFAGSLLILISGFILLRYEPLKTTQNRKVS